MNPVELQVVDLAREMFVTAFLLSAPLLLVGLIVGVGVSLFQALTSVQEQTLSMVPKLFAVLVVALLLLTPMINMLREYALRVLGQLQSFGLS
jgi:flagellar biosynthetic protein FliQ